MEASAGKNHNGKTLRGRAALVTGGGSGIGRAIAQRLAAAGADVIITSLTRERVQLLPDEFKYFPSSSELAGVQQEIEATSARCLALDGDVSRPEEIQRIVQAGLDAFGRVDVLVNCAATSCVHSVLDHPLDTWKRVIDVNLTGALICAQAVLPRMLADGWGRIINIGSTAASAGAAERSAYVASKHGLLGLTRCLALEVAAFNITANLISPASVETTSSPIFVQRKATLEGKTYADKWNETISAYPKKRLISPDEVAELAYFLTRDEAQAINGEDFRITMGTLW